MSTMWLGVDPGTSGGAAFFDVGGDAVLWGAKWYPNTKDGGWWMVMSDRGKVHCQTLQRVGTLVGVRARWEAMAARRSCEGHALGVASEWWTRKIPAKRVRPMIKCAWNGGKVVSPMEALAHYYLEIPVADWRWETLNLRSRCTKERAKEAAMYYVKTRFPGALGPLEKSHHVAEAVCIGRCAQRREVLARP